MPKARYKTCTFEKCRKHRHGTSSLCDEHFKAKHGKPADARSGRARSRSGAGRSSGRLILRQRPHRARVDAGSVK